METKLKPSLTFSRKDFNEVDSIESGDGNRYHKFMNKQFDSGDAFNQYMADTGLNDTGVTQSFGTPNQHPLLRSRRGSFAGAVPMEDGTVKSWRMSSLATSEALNAPDADTAEVTYQDVASQLMKRAVNTVDKDQTVNTVLSDFTKVQFNAFDPSGGVFEQTQSTHAMGVSGVGLHKDVTMEQKKILYEPNITTMVQRDLKPTASSAFHSEPMAITLHNQARQNQGLNSLHNESEMIGIMESFPNQICAQCGPMLSLRVGTNGAVTGNPGVKFGGQKEGAISPHILTDPLGNQKTTATVFRSAPISELKDDLTNKQQVRAIHAAHK